MIVEAQDSLPANIPAKNQIKTGPLGDQRSKNMRPLNALLAYV